MPKVLESLELGLCGVFGGPGFRVTYANGDEVGYVMSVFECRHVSGQLRLDGEEVLEARWFAPAEVQTLALSEWAAIVLPRLVRSRGRTWIPPVSWRQPEDG